jgi:hypothetical protein
MPDDTFLLGIDEHTALTLDLDEEMATVHGHGRVTVRRGGASTSFPAGASLPIADLRSAAFGADGAPGMAQVPRERPPAADEHPDRDPAAAFNAALERGDLAAAVAAIGDLDDEPGNGSGTTRRAMLAELAASIRGDVTAPLLDALVAARLAARRAGDWTAADTIRDRLRGLGVELRDSGDTSTWSRPSPGAPRR